MSLFLLELSGIKAALKRSKIRQEPSEERLLKEQNKYNRDEMAARHIEREKKKVKILL